MLRPIITDPNPILRQPSAPVAPEKISVPAMKKLLRDMTETMYVKDGVGIAAVQVGEAVAVCVIHKNYNISNPAEDLILFNPIWTKLSLLKTTDEEGCLSVPGIYGVVKRYKKIKVSALNQNGQALNFVAEGYLARIIQHETDHINGHLFVEKATKLHKIEKEI